jgi:hypothetical protein
MSDAAKRALARLDPDAKALLRRHVDEQRDIATEDWASDYFEDYRLERELGDAAEAHSDLVAIANRARAISGE